MEVEGSRAVLVDRGADRAIVYLHGRCGDPQGFKSWAPAVRAIGTLVGVGGTIACGAGERTRYGGDIAALDRRIGRALEAVFGKPPSRPLLLVGYSEGASRAEALAARFPERYRRIALGGPPRAPEPASFEGAEAVAVVTGELDRREAVRAEAERLRAAGVPARFFVLPAAGHGSYGPEGARVMGDVLGWLAGAPSGRDRARGAPAR